MPHPCPSIRIASVLLLPALLGPGTALGQTGATPGSGAGAAESAPAAPAATPATGAESGTPVLPAGGKPTPAQQAVLDRIRRLRDGDQRRFGSCSYRWDRWKLLPDGTRTTTYSCEAPRITDRTVGVNCSKLQINSYDPASAAGDKTVDKAGDKAERWAWGPWRLPAAGGEEQMVATLCANALPPPPAAATVAAPVVPGAVKTPASKGR